MTTKQKYSYNKDFFKYDNELSYYWAGFIAADGCILKNKYSNILKIALSIKDIDHLEKFKNDIESNHPIKTYDSYCQIYITSNDFENDLKRFNIVKNKTHIYTFPINLNQNLIHHFMRGYFDGDGSWYYHKVINKTNQLCFSLRGTLDFLKIYKNYLNENNIDTKSNCLLSSGIGQLSISGNKITEKIINYLYKDANIYLDRKYKKAHLSI